MGAGRNRIALFYRVLATGCGKRYDVMFSESLLACLGVHDLSGAENVGIVPEKSLNCLVLN